MDGGRGANGERARSRGQGVVRSWSAKTRGAGLSAYGGDGCPSPVSGTSKRGLGGLTSSRVHPAVAMGREEVDRSQPETRARAGDSRDHAARESVSCGRVLCCIERRVSGCVAMSELGEERGRRDEGRTGRRCDVALGAETRGTTRHVLGHLCRASRVLGQ